MQAEEGKEINAELKAENEQLKRQHEGDKGLITSTGKMNYQLLQEYDKLKTTLTEIKEIAEKAKKDICNNCGWRNTDSCDPTDYTCGEFIKILQKISECEGNDG